MAVDPNALPPYMRQVLQDAGVPNINLDPSERITIQIAPDEPAPVQITTQPYTLPAQPQQPVSTSPMQGQPYQVGDLVGYESGDTVPVSNKDPYVPLPQPQPKPEPIPVESTGPADINKAIADLVELVRTGQISKQEYEIRKQEIILRQQFDIEREKLRAKTALEKKQIDQNIAIYQANAQREADVARALVMVAYKANRPDAELVNSIMSPMSGLSSLYKAVGPVQGANIQLPRRN